MWWGTSWCETNILQNLKRKCWGTWYIISPLSEKVGGNVPRVPHLIAPMLTVQTWLEYKSFKKYLQSLYFHNHASCIFFIITLSVYIGMRLHLHTFFTMFCACSFFLLCLFDLQLLFFNPFQKIISRVDWLNDRHRPSTIQDDTSPLFVYTDQLLCHCFHLL